jgi:RNA polymerase sigma-70 factor (ECF subfamily)
VQGGQVQVDPQLVRAVQRAEPGAMDALIRATYADVYALARRLLGDPSDAADATQEVYVKVVRSVMAFRAEASFGSWLDRTTVDVCLAALRARGDVHARGQSAGAGELPVDLADPAPDPSERAASADLAARTSAALAALSDDAREVVVLRDVQGLSTKETAGVLGISEGAVKVRLHRAHARLRELVG